MMSVDDTTSDFDWMIIAIEFDKVVQSNSKDCTIQSMHHPSIQPSTMLTGGLTWASQLVQLYVNATDDTLDFSSFVYSS